MHTQALELNSHQEPSSFATVLEVPLFDLQSVPISPKSSTLPSSPILLPGIRSRYAAHTAIANRQAKDPKYNPDNLVDEVSHLADRRDWEDALRHAVSLGNLSVFRDILSKESAKNMHQDLTEHPLYFVLTKYFECGGSLDLLEINLELGTDINFQASDDASPLHLLCLCLSLRYHYELDGSICRSPWLYPDELLNLIINLSKYFLDKTANVDLRNKKGKTPLQVLVTRMNSFEKHQPEKLFWRILSIIHRFLKRGANSNIFVESGETLFEICFIFCSVPYHDAFIAHPALQMLCQNIDLGEPLSNGDFPLHRVLKATKYNFSTKSPEGRWKSVNILLKRGADPNQRDTSGRSPLIAFLKYKFVSRRCAYIEPLVALLGGGANAALRCPDSGDLPIYIAAKISHVKRGDLIRLLVDAMQIEQFGSFESRLHPDRKWWLQYLILRWQNKMWSTEKVEQLLFDDISNPQLGLRKTLLGFLAEDIHYNLGASHKRLQASMGTGHHVTMLEFQCMHRIQFDCHRLKLPFSKDLSSMTAMN